MACDFPRTKGRSSSSEAGAPFVQVFRSEDGDWAGERHPAGSIQVVGDEAFGRGNFNPQEGGPKGIDLIPGETLMVASCEEQPLAFFDMRDLIPIAALPNPQQHETEAERAREALLRYFSSSRLKVEDATEAIRRASALELSSVTRSLYWRATAPLRWITWNLRSAAHRRWRWAR